MAKTEGFVVNQGHRLALEALIATGVTLHLYVNHVASRPEDEWTDYEEAHLAGYRAVPLLPQNWRILDGHGVARAEYPDVEFVFGARGGVIYGYALLVRGDLYGVSPLEQPFPILNVGDALVVKPILVQGQPANLPV